MAEIFKKENVLENVGIKEEVQGEIPPSSFVEDTGPLEDTCTVYIKEESEPSDYIKKEIIPSVYIKEKIPPSVYIKEEIPPSVYTKEEIPPSVYIKEEDVKVEITETKGKTLI